MEIALNAIDIADTSIQRSCAKGVLNYIQSCCSYILLYNSLRQTDNDVGGYMRYLMHI